MQPENGGRSVFYHDRVVPLAEMTAEVERLTPDDIRRVADRLFGAGEFAFAAIGPFGKRRRKPAS